MDLSPSGPASIVVTSIASPNAVLRELASQSKTRGLFFFVIGDVPSPADFSLEGCRFYNLERQRATGFELANLLPLRHYSRKNLGYLLALRTRPAILIETDDDNMPLPEFWLPRVPEPSARVLRGAGWTNVYTYFSNANVWPRGLPLDAVRATPPAFESLPELQADCPIQQGLANGNPDVDAIYRLVLNGPIEFQPGRRVALGRGAWCPFNSQNTVWFPKAYPLLYLPSYCSFRMTDIWRSFVAQRIAWENGWHVLFQSADVFQERNEHNLMRDFADEVPGYLHNRKIAEGLERLQLAPGLDNMSENLIRCYEELIRLAVTGAEEMTLLQAWLQDLSTIQ